MRLPNAEVLQHTSRYLELIAGREMSLEEKQAFIAETVDSYERYYNRGFITYRKSVTQAGQFAALEWSGEGVRASRPPRPRVHRLPRRLRHLQRRRQPPQDREGA